MEWMTHTAKSGYKIATETGLSRPPFLKEYVDNILTSINHRPGYTGDPVEEFHQCLNAIHPRVQFTVGKEEDGAIPFLDCYLQRLPNG
jgi:hypothetical protein